MGDSKVPGKANIVGMDMGWPTMTANVVGAAFCTFYFVFLDPAEVAPEFDQDLFLSLVVTVLLVGVGFYTGGRWQRDLIRAHVVFSRGGRPDRELLRKAQRKALNGPFFFSLLSLFNWGVAATIMSLETLFSTLRFESFGFSFYQASRLFFGITASGVVTAVVVFFLLDVRFRKVRPLFFPDGGLVQTRGVFRLRVRRRLLGTFLLVGVAPMILVSGLFYHKLMVSLSDGFHPDFTGVFLVLATVPAALLLTAWILSRLVAASIADPIRRLDEAMGQVRSGDLTIELDVTDNDELGALTESFNEMTEGLREKARLQHSLDLAMEVQQSLLPRETPQRPGLDIAGLSRYCDETGGDYFDYLDFPDGGRPLGAAVGDVSGHGLQSALLMCSVRAYLRQSVGLGLGPGRALTTINRELARDVMESGMFMTLFYCELDPSKMELTWASAGHDPAWLYDPDRDVFHETTVSGPALGFLEEFSYAEEKTDLPAGGILVMGTDGLWEAAGPDGERFGKDRLKQIVRAHNDFGAADIVEAVFQALSAFRGGRPQEDDITLVVVRVSG